MIVRLWGEEGVDYERLYLRSHFSSHLLSGLSKILRETPEVDRVLIDPRYPRLAARLGMERFTQGDPLLSGSLVHMNLGSIHLSPRILSGMIGLHRQEGRPVCAITEESPYRWHLFHGGRVVYQRDVLLSECPVQISTPGATGESPSHPASWVVGALNENGDLVDVYQAPVSSSPLHVAVTDGNPSELPGHLSIPREPGVERFRILRVEWTGSSREATFRLQARFPGLWRFDFRGSRWLREEDGHEITGRQDAPDFVTVSNALMISSIREHQSRMHWLRTADVLAYRLSGEEAKIVRNEVDLLRSLPSASSRIPVVQEERRGYV